MQIDLFFHVRLQKTYFPVMAAIYYLYVVGSSVDEDIEVVTDHLQLLHGVLDVDSQNFEFFGFYDFGSLFLLNAGNKSKLAEVGRRRAALSISLPLCFSICRSSLGRASSIA